jgi:hypothetical protein
VCVQDDAIEARVGPFPDGRVRAELEHDEGAVGLRRVLDAVVDRVALRADDDGDWVTLTKTVEPPEGAA